MKKRPKWDDIWMGLAAKLSERATCKVPNRAVGCVVVSADNQRVLSNGYNGGAAGDPTECKYTNNETKIGSSRCTCVHAEMNALTKLDVTNPCRKKMYVTLSPCALCWQLIINAGIDELIYRDLYNQEYVDNLVRLGVTVRRYINGDNSG